MTFTDEQKALMNNERTVKTMRIEFDDPTFNSIDANHIYQESLEIEESLFDGELRFGKCNASMFKTKIADINEDIIGQTIYPYITFTLGNDTLDVPFGQYIIQSAERTSDRRWLMITAVDQMSLFDVDIAEWYNTVLYPTDSTTRTVKYIRDELCSYINIEQATVTLANDDLVIPKTINPDSLSARDLLQAICELNGCFGHFDWEGVLQYIFMQEDGLYPSETLYPSDDLFPRNGHASSVSDEYISVYKNCDFADYTVKRIDSVAILKEDGSLAVHYEPSENYENRYIISGNILLYGFNTTQLQSIAATIYEEISDSAFVPNTTEVFGCAYMQLGQDYTVVTRYYSGSNVIERQIESFFIKRTIHGIQAMFSTIVSEGTEYLPKVQTNDVLSEMTILRGKSAKYERDLEHLSSELIDYEEQTNSLIKQTANEITLSVAKSSDIWDEVDGQGNPLNITSRDYISIPSNNKVVIPIGDPIPFEGMNINDYYLDLSTGKVYTLSDIGATTSGITFTFSIPILNQNINQLNTTKSVLQSQITQNADSIALEVSRAIGAENTLSSQILQTSESITLSVSKDQVVWLEESPVGTSLSIKYRDYHTPRTTVTSDEYNLYFPDGLAVNDLYLNMLNGVVAKVTNISTDASTGTKTITWNTSYKVLDKAEEHLISRINQTAEQITIQASKISLEGLVTVNGKFEIDQYGSMKATGGRIGGWFIQDRCISSTNGTVSLDSNNNTIWIKDWIDDNTYLSIILDSDGYKNIRYYDYSSGEGEVIIDPFDPEHHIEDYPYKTYKKYARVFSIDDGAGFEIESYYYEADQLDEHTTGVIKDELVSLVELKHNYVQINRTLKFSNSNNNISGLGLIEDSYLEIKSPLNIPSIYVDYSSTNGTSGVAQIGFGGSNNWYIGCEDVNNFIITNRGDLSNAQQYTAMAINYANGHYYLYCENLLTGNGPVVSGSAISMLTYANSSYMEVATSYGAYGVNWWLSDTKLKENIVPTEKTALDKINQINFVQFDWKENEENKDTDRHVDLGVSANQIEEFMPDAVYEITQPEDSEFDTLKNIDTGKMTTYALKAIQELYQLVLEQQKEINKLKENTK